MMDKLKVWGPILGIVASIITAVMGAGPIGAILGGVGGIATAVIGLMARNWYMNWKFANAHKNENEQAISDAGKVIEGNTELSKDDEKTLSQSKKDKLGAFTNKKK